MPGIICRPCRKELVKNNGKNFTQSSQEMGTRYPQAVYQEKNNHRVVASTSETTRVKTIIGYLKDQLAEVVTEPSTEIGSFGHCRQEYTIVFSHWKIIQQIISKQYVPAITLLNNLSQRNENVHPHKNMQIKCSQQLHFQEPKSWNKLNVP